MPLPDKDTRILPGDVIGVIGTDDQIGQRLAQGDISHKYHAMLLRVIRKDGTEEQLCANLTFEAGDTLWLVGDPDYITKLK